MRKQEGFMNDKTQPSAIAHILIVDDREENLLALEGWLEDPGLEIVKATSGNQALGLLLEEDFALVLLDVQMPEMDGFETAELMRMSEKTKNVPIIFVTAISKDRQNIFKGYAAGAVDYLPKPIDPDILKAKVDVFLQLYRQKRSLIEIQAVLMESLQKNNDALKAAGSIQFSLLPKNFSVGNQENFAWKFTPCDAVGGDIFNFVHLDVSHIGIYMLDVAGHGIPSAMISVLVYQLLNPHTGILVDHTVNPPLILEPEAVLNILDREFPLMRFKRHFTIVYAVLDISSNTLTYSNAAHCAPIIVPRENDLKILTVSGTVIGINAFPFGQETVTLAPGDKVVFLSDGVFESRNSDGELFGEDRLYQTLRELRSFSLDDLVQGLYAKVMAFAEAQPADDDMSILALEIKDLNDAAFNKMQDGQDEPQESRLSNAVSSL
jgi:sigma-B regulation protein RsbU (phosphoserine phosphatase)